MKRYAICGTGHRAWMFVNALMGDHRGDGEIVAWIDPNPVRAAAFEKRVAEAIGGVRPIFGPDELERVLAELAVDR
ncbi:MAG: hypothetical protein KIT69_00515, partial [Propionibacteriaceae bacterium]|nr:hypothetical protein [Propionibacteriaceae bacterium]